MRYVTLGASGLHVSPIALGTGRFWDDNSPDPERVVRAARRAGINFFDTARIYGNGRAEHILAAALGDDLRRHRDELVIASKGGMRLTPEGARRDATPERVRQDVDDSLAALGVDTIDLYHLHWPDPAVPVADTAGALADLVDEGKIGHVGLSNFDTDQVEQFNAVLPATVLQIPYHFFDRHVEPDLLPFARAHDLGVLAYGVFGHGLLGDGLTGHEVFPADDWRSVSPMYQGEAYQANLACVARLRTFARDTLGCSLGQLAVAWVLANPAVHVAIVGTSNAEHLHESIAALDLRLGPSDLAEVDDIMAGARPSPGPTPESTPAV